MLRYLMIGQNKMSVGIVIVQMCEFISISTEKYLRTINLILYLPPLCLLPGLEEKS